MTLAPENRRVPQFGLGHRLALAREVSGMDQFAMADILGVGRTSISNYETGKSRPGKLAINAWAVATGVDVEWLKTGKAQDDSPRDGGPKGQPSDYKATVVPLRSAGRRAA